MFKAARWSGAADCLRNREILEGISNFVNAINNVSRFFSGVVEFHELRQNASVSRDVFHKYGKKSFSIRTALITPFDPLPTKT